MKPTFYDGLATPFRGIKFLLSNLSLIRYFLIPFGINVLIFGIGTWIFYAYFGDIVAWVPTWEAWYGKILYYLVAIVFVLIYALFMAFGFTAIGSIIASPFLDVLSERTEEIRSGKKIDEPFSVKVLVKDAGAAVSNEIKKLSIFVGLQIALLLLNLLPAIGSIVYAICAPLLTIFFLAFEYLDFTLSRKRIKFGDKMKFISDNKGACMGMGAAFFFTTVVPFINFFVMPVAVIGATLLYLGIMNIEVSHSQPSPADPGKTKISIDEVVDDVISNT